MFGKPGKRDRQHTEILEALNGIGAKLDAIREQSYNSGAAVLETMAADFTIANDKLEEIKTTLSDRIDIHLVNNFIDIKGVFEDMVRKLNAIIGILAVQEKAPDTALADALKELAMATRALPQEFKESIQSARARAPVPRMVSRPLSVAKEEPSGIDNEPLAKAAPVNEATVQAAQKIDPAMRGLTAMERSRLRRMGHKE